MRKAIRALILWAVPELKQQGAVVYIVGDSFGVEPQRTRSPRFSGVN